MRFLHSASFAPPQQLQKDVTSKYNAPILLKFGYLFP